MPRFQNEPMLRTLFADQAGVEDLHRVAGELKAHIDERRRAGIEQMESYLTGEGLFQDRAHIVVLTGELIRRLLNALDDWADLVTEVSADWDTTAGIGLNNDIRAILEGFLADGAERIRHTEPGR
jgi:hypothetical protein